MARLTARHAHWVLLVGLALSGVSGAILTTLRINSDLMVLLPPGLSGVKNLNRLYDKTGGFGSVVVLAEGDQAKAKTYFAELAPEIRKLPWVRHAEYEVDLKAIGSYGALYMDATDLQTIHERMQRQLEAAVGADLDLDDDDKPPPFTFKDITQKYKKRAKDRRDPYVSKDGQLRAMRIFTRARSAANVPFGRRTTADIQRLVDARAARAKELGLTISIGGKFWDVVQDFHAVTKDLKRSAMWGGLLIVLLLTVYFRHVLAVPLLLIPLGMGMSWTFAITKLTLGNLNVITSFLFVILLGLGIDFGIHFFARFRREREGGRDLEDAVAVTLATTGLACRTAAFTTTAAFAALVITDFRGSRDFGIIAAIGVATAFVAMNSMLPALLALSERLRILRFKQKRRAATADDQAAHKTPPLSPGHRRVVGIAVLVCVAAATWGGVMATRGKIAFETNFDKLNTLPAHVKHRKAQIRRIFGLSYNGAVVFVDSMSEAAALKEQVVQHMATDPTPTIAKVLSLHEFLPANQEAKLPWIRKIQVLLKKRAIRKEIEELPKDQRDRIAELEKKVVTRPMVWQDLPPGVSQAFLGLPGVKGTLVIITPTRLPRDAVFASAFVKDTREFKTQQHTYHPASEAVIFAEVNRLIVADGKIAVVVTLLVVLIILFVDFRRLSLTLLSFVPLFVAVGWLLMVMVLWPLKFNMFNMVVLPSVIGLGIDSSVHLVHRWLELGPGHLKQVLMTIMGPICVSTLTTMVGFGGLLAAHQKGLHSLGVLAVLGMGLTLLTVTTVLPAFILWLEGRQPPD